MAQTFASDVTFVVHDKPTPYRFEVSVTDENKLTIWIEDRQSKKQWNTEALDTAAFVNADNAIPKATIADYAKRFAGCLAAPDDEAKFGHALTTTKGGERVLSLTLPLQWASWDVAVEYKFALREVPLERIDLLSARLRDVEEHVATGGKEHLRALESEIKTLRDEIKVLGDRADAVEREREPVFVQAKTSGQHTANQKLVWTAGDCGGRGVEVLSDGRIRFRATGVYAIDVGVVHAAVHNSVTIFEVKRDESALASACGSSHHGHYVTTPLRYMLKAQPNDEISVVYKAPGYAYPGSYLAIVKL